MLKTYGIHHISSIVGQGQRNLDFYASILGMRLVKQTLNYDDYSTHHLYYSNTDGTTPLLTTFPFNDSEEIELGGGQVKTQVLAIPRGTLEFWKDRLNHYNIQYIQTDIGIKFIDPDGLRLMFVEKDYKPINPWEFNKISKAEAIIGIDSAILLSANYGKTYTLLTDILGYKLINETSEAYYLQINEDLGGSLILLKENKEVGKLDRGTVHHIAFKVKDDEIEAWKIHLVKNGFFPTDVKDRNYFKSVYFREKGGIIIELATLGTGVGIDEPIDHLGESLIIPEHFENYKDEIFEKMMPLFIREIDKVESYGYRNRYEYDLLKEKEKNRKVIQDLLAIKKTRELTSSEEKKLKIEKAKYMRRGKTNE